MLSLLVYNFIINNYVTFLTISAVKQFPLSVGTKNYYVFLPQTFSFLSLVLVSLFVGYWQIFQCQTPWSSLLAMRMPRKCQQLLDGFSGSTLKTCDSVGKHPLLLLSDPNFCCFTYGWTELQQPYQHREEKAKRNTETWPS